MSIQKATSTQILAHNLHYSTHPTEIGELIVEKHGVLTFGVWSYLLMQAEHFEIRKDYLCRRLRLSERAFQDCMRNLKDMDLAWLENGTRSAAGTLSGKRWHITALPPHVLKAVDNYIADQRTDSPKSAESVKPAENPVITGPWPDSTDYADYRQSVKRGHLTNNKYKNKNKYKLTIHAQTEFARFYETYPRKRDRFRAEEQWAEQTRGMDDAKITEFTDKLIADYEYRIQSGDWNNQLYMPYAAGYLENRRWEDDRESPESKLALGMALGLTPRQINAAFDDDIIPSRSTRDITLEEQLADRSWANY